MEEWTEPTGPHAHGHSDPGSPGYRDGHLSVPEDEASVLDSRDQEEDVHYCPSEEAYQDYYPAEANGNAGSTSPYRPRRRDGDPEDQEEDIDQIVAEIKMSLSMSSITSGGEASPEHAPRGPEPGPGDSPEACPLAEASRGPNRHEGRPKSLNLPPEAKHPADPQRSFKTKTRTPEERPKWPQEEVRFWLALGKRREGLRAKVSMQPTGQNASQRSTCSVMCGLSSHSCSPIRCCSNC